LDSVVFLPRKASGIKYFFELVIGLVPLISFAFVTVFVCHNFLAIRHLTVAPIEPAEEAVPCLALGPCRALH
jgi:hypothetical protein